MTLIKYAIADDHKIFRQGLRFALADDHKLKLVGEAENGLMLLDLVISQKPDVVLLDLKMPQMDGIETTRRLHDAHPDVKILMLTTFDDEHFILHLLELGANGYLLKNSDPDEIKKAIHTVYENDYYFNHLVSTTMLRKLTSKNGNMPGAHYCRDRRKDIPQPTHHRGHQDFTYRENRREKYSRAGGICP
jgi:DNA-binding NarL/FixJ family response regulator